jgi:hypothetical protein
MTRLLTIAEPGQVSSEEMTSPITVARTGRREA